MGVTCDPELTFGPLGSTWLLPSPKVGLVIETERGGMVALIHPGMLNEWVKIQSYQKVGAATGV